MLFRSLDPKAPLRIAAFTPQFFGWGEIGQFSTYAMPLAGFWTALGALGLMLGAALWRQHICRSCPLFAHCGPTCHPKLLGDAVMR